MRLRPARHVGHRVPRLSLLLRRSARCRASAARGLARSRSTARQAGLARTTLGPERFRLGSEAEEASDVGHGEANVDTVQGAALLVRAAREGGEPAWREMATSHARRHIEFRIRSD